MNLISETPKLFEQGRKLLMQGIKNLWEIRDKGLWKGMTSSFTEYVEDVCQLDKGQASRYLAVYEHFVLHGGVEHAQLGAIDPERLYVARKLKGNIDYQLTVAKELSRNELRATITDKDDCDRHEWIEICTKCHKRKI